MDNQKGKTNRSAVLKQVAIGLAILAVLSCTILGSAVLTMREGALISALRPTATSTLQPLVLLTPAETPTTTATLTSAQPTPTAAGTVQARAETQTVPVPSPSATLTRPGTSTATTTPTMTASPTVHATATAAAELTATTAATATPIATAIATATARPSATATSRPTCIVPASWRIYVVQAGDTLSSLATQRGTTVAAIVSANCLASSTIYAGQRLYLPPVAVPPPPPPPPTTCVPQPPTGWVLYTVQAGDSLYGLAQRFQTTVLRIQQVNCLSGYVVSVGQQIYLPPLPSTPTATWTLVPTAETTPTDVAAPTTSPTPVTPSDTPTTAATPTVPMDTPTPVPTTPVPTPEADPPAEATATATSSG